MKKEYTILCPMMAPIHASIILPVFAKEGFAAAAGQGAQAVVIGRLHQNTDDQSQRSNDHKNNRNNIQKTHVIVPP